MEIPLILELRESVGLYLKVIGNLCILGHLANWFLHSVEMFHAKAFSRVNRTSGSNGETHEWKFDELRLIPLSAIHERQSTSPSIEL